jgi:hypothetical protein
MSSVFKTANVSNLASKTGGFYIAVLLVPPTRGKRSVRSRAIVRQRRAGVHSLLELFGLGHGEHAEALELDVGRSAQARWPRRAAQSVSLKNGRPILPQGLTPSPGALLPREALKDCIDDAVGEGPIEVTAEDEAEIHRPS